MQMQIRGIQRYNGIAQTTSASTWASDSDSTHWSLNGRSVLQSFSLPVDQRQSPGAAIPIWWSAVFQLTASGIARVPESPSPDPCPISLPYISPIPSSRFPIPQPRQWAFRLGLRWRRRSFFGDSDSNSDTDRSTRGVHWKKQCVIHITKTAECNYLSDSQAEVRNPLKEPLFIYSYHGRFDIFNWYFNVR